MTKIQNRKCSHAIRAASNGPTVEGYAALFNNITDMGTYYESIERDAFNDADLSDVRLLINHDGIPLARTKSGTMAVMVDERGLRYLATLDQTEQAYQLASAARRGDLNQSSFAFTIQKQRWTETRGRAHRVIEKIGVVTDVSPVTYAAYPDTNFSVK